MTVEGRRKPPQEDLPGSIDVIGGRWRKTSAVLRLGSRRKVDAIIALRRDRGAMTLREYTWRTRGLDAPRTLTLEIGAELPDRCAGHGRQSVEYRDTELRLHQGSRGQVESSWWSSFRWSLLALDKMPPSTSVQVVGRWPMCRACVRHRRVLEFFAYCLGLVFRA